MVNLTITAACLGTFPIEDAYRYWGYMKQLRASGELEPDIAHLLDVYIRRFETDGFAIAVTPKKSRLIRTCGKSCTIFICRRTRA